MDNPDKLQIIEDLEKLGLHFRLSEIRALLTLTVDGHLRRFVDSKTRN